jgi:DNA-binding CsgD family transcriptional regulator
MELKRNPKAPSNNRGWSTADDSTLIKMARGGASAAEIAKILGRTVMAVTTRKHNLHVDVRLASSKGKLVDVPKSVSVKNRNKRKELPVKVISRTLVAQPINVAPATGTTKSKKSKIVKLTWSKEEDAKLLSLIAEGKSANEIGKILGRTAVAITVRKHALKKSQAIANKKANVKEDMKKADMLLRMEKARAAKGKNKNLQVSEKVASVPVAKEEKMVSAAQPMKESDFDALSRIAKSTGATITVVFGK